MTKPQEPAEVLQQQHRDLIEDLLERPLAADELEEVAHLNDLSAGQLTLGRVLAKHQGVLCIRYLEAVVTDLDQRTAIAFMDDVLMYGPKARSWQSRR